MSITQISDALLYKQGACGSEEIHGIPMTINEIYRVLSWWRKDGFKITGLKIWRYGKQELCALS